ncbi:MAG TPA: 3-hydroxyacyl-CoA dehydrogenase/enoyl-CoA hydratase family protein, partial [Terriglobia bacterium]|nr:3-hydroxyacyl-CoA dehydrogenase/enoyl-CoA hydratase family protein [Terriglobia bacterium]
MKRDIENVVVVGTGVMGAAIAAHFANARFSVTLLDIVPQELDTGEIRQGLDLRSPVVRNRIVKGGLERARNTKPPALFLPEYAEDIRLGNLEDNFRWFTEADWIIEAITEDYQLKRVLLERIDSLRSPGTIVSSNTSGIPIRKLASGLSEDFRRHFLGIHFFNPPRYMKLVESVQAEETLPEVFEKVAEICDRQLGKGIVSAKDTPYFIANRIGTFAIQTVFQLMSECGLGIDEIDQLTGPILGRPKSATFRTLDIIGLDTYAYIVHNIYESVSNDEQREAFRVPALVKVLVEKKWLGDKTHQGFYKKLKTQGILTLDPCTLEYGPRRETHFPSLDEARSFPILEERLRFLINRPDKVGEFVWKSLSRTLVYTANRIPEVSDSIVDVDNVLKWGFNWELGPFEIWDALGVNTVADRIRQERGMLPTLIEKLLSTAEKRFYTKQDGTRCYFVPDSRHHIPIPSHAGVLFISDLKAHERVIRENRSGSLIDMGDGVAVLEFHSKMNTIDGNLLQLMEDALAVAHDSFLGLVIGNQGQHFSAGANLQFILKLAQDKNWQGIDQMIRNFQRVNMKIKYSPCAVVVAPFGLTLGGGCEIALHACCLQAHSETYMGLVELGVGLIPAAGGIKEMLLRTQAKTHNRPTPDYVSHLRSTFENIATAKTSACAVEARNLGFLRDTDGITMNRDRLLADAKARVLELSRQGYRKPLPTRGITAMGNRVLSILKLGIHLARRAEQITDYDVHL